MGWCSATIIFDVVASALLDEQSPYTKEQVLEKLIAMLENGDWDCQRDSKYYNHPIVQAIMRKRHPRWFEQE